MVKLVIFDFDGVVISGSNEAYFKCYHKALKAVGVQPTPQKERKRILDIWGKGYVYQLAHLLKEHPELLEKAVKAYKKCYYSPLFSKNIQLIKNADAALKKLANKYTLAIATGIIRKRLDVLLEQFQITNLFKEIVSSSDIPNPDDKKPAPYMLNKIINNLGFVANDVVYVGDAASDVQMARNARVTPVVVLTGHLTRKEAKSLKVTHIIPDITYLQKELIKVE